MKTKLIFLSILSIAFLAYSFKNVSYQGEKEPWTNEQLMEPSELAKIIRDSTAKKPIIFSIGPGGNIKGCVEMGSAQEKENLDKLKSALSKMNRDTAIVIFCGCCPFNKCPNIRPAFELMNEMKFSNHKLLNIPNNLKVDWIDKGFPLND